MPIIAPTDPDDRAAHGAVRAARGAAHRHRPGRVGGRADAAIRVALPAGDPEITLAPLGSPLLGQRIFPAESLAGGHRDAHRSPAASGVDLPTVNTFDRITADGLTGILAYQFGRYVFLVENPAALRVTPGELAPCLRCCPAGRPDEWTLCAFNAENLFDAVDDEDGDMGDWAPADAAAYRRQVERRAGA